MKQEKYAPSNTASRAQTPEVAELFKSIEKYSIAHEASPMSVVYHIRSNVYAILVSGNNWVYLIRGPEKALLLDTGFGLSDLKGLCEELIGDMPLIVVNTHDHFDHSGGNFQFDTVYLHLYDAAILIQDIRPEKYFEFNGKDHKQMLDMYHIPFKEYNVVGFTDNHSFDLGDGYIIDTVRVSGHSAGGIMLIDKQNGICFGGDATGGIVHGSKGPMYAHNECMTIEEYRNCILELKKHMGAFDIMYNGHTQGISKELVIGKPEWMLRRLDLCERILADPHGCGSEEVVVRGGKLTLTGLIDDDCMILYRGDKAIYKDSSRLL